MASSCPHDAVSSEYIVNGELSEKKGLCTVDAIPFDRRALSVVPMVNQHDLMLLLRHEQSHGHANDYWYSRKLHLLFKSSSISKA